MTSLAISPKTLGKCIYEGDIYNCVDILDPEKKKGLIDSAYSASLSSELSFSTVQIKRNGKSCYTLKDFDQVLISRNLANNLRKVLDKSKSRNQISRQLVQHLKEGTSYRIYRLDIKSFFESVEFSTIRSSLEKSKVSNQTRLLISSIIKGLNQPDNKGIPRGLEFSPSLAELVLSDFDKEMKNHKDVFFYCRYVDDIIVITTGFEDKKTFLKCIKSKLPNELSLNYNKQKVIFVDSRTKQDKVVATFDYLGYNYSVRDTETKANKNLFREVDISLSTSRMKKIKTRISRSLFCFSKDGNFEILKQRLDFLTSNRLMKDKKSKRIIATGIYYNNVNLTDDSESLIELDEYLKKTILGYSCNRGANFTNILSKNQKRELLKFSFMNGYRNNNYKKFSPNKLGEIKNAWRY
ncbi:antiviral reverse transcriptase Drt3a [Vibrio mediterranei]|uniref:antiviral reverse transcriptase Drt3a n=1 Tax=Vibrio mediterranei TaxID=689 RepID=UPI00228539A7|nr:antiviral reverse transcriptase Drt3a [Vibrio mediterranei]MCY9853232.1 RNA-directed DNA polymerase [Vibrio mediterranei]